MAELLAHPYDGEYYRDRSAELEKITGPVLSAANWGHPPHTRGGFEGYTRVASDQRWLEVHGLGHITEFYTDYGVALQKRPFGRFLKGQDTGWDQQPRVRVQLNIRHTEYPSHRISVTPNIRHTDDSFELRPEQDWPLARTRSKFHLHPHSGALAEEPPRSTRRARSSRLAVTA
ncbi:hypothetical protein ABZV31_32175 [Streptomyces sp. NPDC005202]|uniref:hypothetical protein n=1 Tax=Streptomyces sp. NPDC005202 TaxID=3157021 RepID=UPI0033B9743E